MTDSVLFRTQAALFAASIVHSALVKLEKMRASGGFELEWNGFELSGTEKRGTGIGLIRLLFGKHPFAYATCRLTCVDGEWQTGVVEIRFSDATQDSEKSKWKFCGRLNTKHALEVYELEE